MGVRPSNFSETFEPLERIGLHEPQQAAVAE